MSKRRSTPTIGEWVTAIRDTSNKADCAAMLGVSESSVYKKMGELSREVVKNDDGTLNMKDGGFGFTTLFDHWTESPRGRKAKVVTLADLEAIRLQFGLPAAE